MLKARALPHLAKPPAHVAEAPWWRRATRPLTQRGLGTDFEVAVLLAAFVLGFERLLRLSFEA